MRTWGWRGLGGERGAASGGGRRLGVEAGVDELVVPAGEARHLPVEEEAEYLGVLLELVLAHPDRRERDAEGAVLGLVPAGADPALDPAAREGGDGAERLGPEPRGPGAP